MPCAARAPDLARAQVGRHEGRSVLSGRGLRIREHLEVIPTSMVQIRYTPKELEVLADARSPGYGAPGPVSRVVHPGGRNPS